MLQTVFPEVSIPGHQKAPSSPEKMGVPRPTLVCKWRNAENSPSPCTAPGEHRQGRCTSEAEVFRPQERDPRTHCGSHHTLSRAGAGTCHQTHKYSCSATYDCLHYTDSLVAGKVRFCSQVSSHQVRFGCQLSHKKNFHFLSSFRMADKVPWASCACQGNTACPVYCKAKPREPAAAHLGCEG